MKKAFLFLLLTFYFLSVSAQRFSVRWNEDFKLTSGIFTNNVYVKSLTTSDNSVISLFRKVKSFSAGNDFILARFNAKAQLEGSIDLNFVDNLKEGFIDIIKLKNNFYLLKYRFINKERAKVIACKLNTKNLVLEKEEKIVGEFEASETASPTLPISTGSLYLFRASTVYSPDSSRFLIVNDPYQKKRQTKTAEIVVLNDDLQKVYTKTYSFKTPFNKTLITNSSVDNEGKVYLFYNVYEKDFSIIRYSDGENVPRFYSNIVIADEKNIASSGIDMKDKFLQTATISTNAEGVKLMVGIYKDKHSGRLSGAVKAQINEEGQPTLVSNISFTPFPEELLEKIDNDNQGKKGGKNPGLDIDFDLNQIITVDNGVTHLIAEYFNFKALGNGATVFIKGDFLVTTFLANGSVEFLRVPRKQETANAASSTNLSGSGSFTTDYYKDKLILFYNDSEDNIARDINAEPDKFAVEKKSALVAALILQNGKLSNRMMVYTHSGMDGFVTNLNFVKVTDNSYLVFSYKSGNFKQGIKVGILTVK